MKGITSYCEQCGKKLKRDECKIEVHIINKDPLLGEITATCPNCQHTQRISVFDHEYMELFTQWKALLKRIQIAEKGMDFRKGAFRQRKYRELIQQEKDLKNKLIERTISLLKIIESAEKLERSE